MARKEFFANYTTLELYLKNLAVEPNTSYVFTLDSLGGEMELYFSRSIGVQHVPASENWVTSQFFFTTGSNVSDFVNWGICFVKTAWAFHAYGGTYNTTFVDNVHLYPVGSSRDLLSGGDFEESLSSSIYDEQWKKAVLGGKGKELGVSLVTDPLDDANHCLCFPDVLQHITYPEPFPLMADTFGCFRAPEQDIFCLDFYGYPHPRFLIAERGCITVQCGESPRQVTTGSLMLLPAHTPCRYTYHASSDAVYYWLSVDGTALQSVLETLNVPAAEIVSLPNAAALTACVESMLQLSEKQLMYFYGVSGYLQLFFNELEKLITISESFEKHSVSIENVAKRLRTNPEAAVSNAKLAEECSLSENYFIRLFKQQLGTTPQHYRQAALMKRARSQLLETSLTVQEISYALGIDDPLYFSRLFRSYYGVSPREYRKTHAP